MFHEYRDLISELKNTDTHFQKMFEEHNQLDTEIDKLENDVVKSTSREDEIDDMKRRKLALKDQIGRYLEEKSQEK